MRGDVHHAADDVELLEGELQLRRVHRLRGAGGGRGEDGKCEEEMCLAHKSRRITRPRAKGRRQKCRTRYMHDVAVVGAGAAGLMAAIFAGRAGKRVVALDAAPKIGAKILISGGGRCNVTHDVVRADDFNGNRNAIGKVLRAFDVAQTIAFFESLGVPLKREETGKLFPVSDRARDVVEALLRAAREANVEVRTCFRASVIRADDLSEERSHHSSFIIHHSSLRRGGFDGHKTGRGPEDLARVGQDRHLLVDLRRCLLT